MFWYVLNIKWSIYLFAAAWVISEAASVHLLPALVLMIMAL